MSWVLVAQSCPPLCGLLDHRLLAHQAPLSMEFSRQEYWRGLPFPSPGVFWTPGLLHCRQILYRLSHQESPPLQNTPLFMSSDQIRSDQSLSHVRLFATPWTAARQASLSITSSRSSPRLTSIESVMPSSHLILCCPLLLLPPVPPSIRVFSNESTLRMRWPKYWSFSFSIIPSKEIPGLMSFRIDWLDLLGVQGTLKSLLQHHSSKASILRCSACFIVQLSHPYMTPGKTIALTRQTFVDKVMSLLFNMLSRLVITFLPGVSIFNFMAAVTICSDFVAQKNKVWHCFHCFSIYFPWWWDWMPWSSFSECWALSQLFHSPLSLSSRSSLVLLHFIL